MPTRVEPMLCTLTKERLDNLDYLFEIKWDGYRIIAYVNKGNSYHNP
jgi:bifunctional non-homologous end joining protein LigD